MPIAGSVIAVIGRPFSMSGLNGTGMMIVTVEDIVYNPGTAHILADSSAATGSTSSPGRRLQVRKRKRDAKDTNGWHRYI